jgi:hypothetical protein
VLEIGQQIAGLVIRKDETHDAAKTDYIGSKILKVCTFKVADEFMGEKFGELLLKQVLWFSQRNRYDLAYLTVYPKHAFLVDLLTYFGFRHTKTLDNGELMLEKPLVHSPLPAAVNNVFDFDCLNYPRYVDGSQTRQFCIPIRPEYHCRLFPEIAFGIDLPLFPKATFEPRLRQGDSRRPGNTIRKVYLCRARITRLRPGDVLYFYMSKDARYEASQSITTVGVVEQVADLSNADELIRLTAKRSVFSGEELRSMKPSQDSPVKMIDFLLVGHSDPAVPLSALLAEGILCGYPPQSIVELDVDRYEKLRPLVQLGF